MVLQDYYSKQQQQEKENTAEEKINLYRLLQNLLRNTSKPLEHHRNDLKSQEAGIEYLPDTITFDQPLWWKALNLK